MTSPGYVSYELVSIGEWVSLNEDLAKIDPNDAYGTVRTFGLEGTATFQVTEVELRWGGFLLDLACGLAAWLEDPTRHTTIHPAEQSNDIEIEPTDGSVTCRTGLDVVTFPTEVAVATVRSWLGVLSRDLARHAPGILSVPGFEWARTIAIEERP